MNGGQTVLRAALFALVTAVTTAAWSGCGDNQITGFASTPTPRPTATPTAPAAVP